MAALDDILGGDMRPKPMTSVNTAGQQVNVLKSVVEKRQQFDNRVAEDKAYQAAIPDEVKSKRGMMPAGEAAGVNPAPGYDGRMSIVDRQKRNYRDMSYVELYEALNPDKPETAEEKAKREKREKSEAILSSVGDGISALANLFYTMRGAPSSYDASNGMSARARQRWDRLRQEREANRRAYNSGLFQAMVMDRQQERDDRNWRHTLERERIADKRYDEKAARDKAMADLEDQLARNEISASGYKAERERIAAQYAGEYEQSKVNRNNAAAGASKASATASQSRARYYDNGGAGGHKKGPTLQLEDDEPKHFDNDKDYDRAVMRYAAEYEVPTTEIQVLEKDRKGNAKKQRTVQRPVKDIAADVERKAEERKKSNKTMPGVGGSGSLTTMPGVKQ